MITQERLIELLRELPESHLELIDLTWKLTGDDGSLDPRKIVFHYIEMEQAISQAETYTRETKEMTQCLTRLLR
jgi:hypothetical protein